MLLEAILAPLGVLDEDHSRSGRPGCPHGQCCGQSQVVVVALSPRLVGIVAGREVDLYPEVEELCPQGLGVLQGGGYLEASRLEEDLQAADQVPLGHAVATMSGHALCVAAGDGHSVEGEAGGASQHVHHRGPHPGGVYDKLGVLLKGRRQKKTLYTLGDLRVSDVAETLEVADVQLVLIAFLNSLLRPFLDPLGYCDGGVVARLAQVQPYVELSQGPYAPNSGAMSSGASPSFACVEGLDSGPNSGATSGLMASSIRS